ncbi:uncharacterized protein LOC120661698 [Panicum virgatum]|uniref:Uncharacterized protein n=1 Tax=Panicum virgatum TaxID=38727 RepID=A0A8T0W2M0_PANVG|nr:uncharacterized protein LOC120661698 [Panicum virgatum]KAG2637749.1 hypothetical protein PVAP13_2NG535500 [Panicum virgatum]
MVRGPAMAPAAGSGAVAAAAAAAAEAAEEMRWRQLDSGVSAVSFGFVATAILVSMFLAMAILEHFLRPPAHAAAPPARGILRRLLGRGGGRGVVPGADLEAARKLEVHAPLEIPVYPKGVSVLMPGQDVPTFIAHPAPAPCPPERIQWPSHQPPPFTSSSSNPS